MERKISWGQLMLLLLLARVMHTMIFRTRDFGSGMPIMLGLLVTTAVEAVLAIPAVIYFQKGGTSPAADVAGKGGIWIELLYSLYFAVIAGGTISLFAEFLHQEFSDTVAPVAAMILIAAAAAYCAGLGIEGLARAGTVVFWLFAVLFVSMALVGEGNFNWLNIRPFAAGDMKAFWNYIVESISSAWWIPMFCILGGHLTRGAWKAAYGFLALKLVIIETLLLLITLVLWRYVSVLGYPIFALGAYAKSDFIQRFDAINMLVWAFNCIFVAAVYVFIAAKPIKKLRLAPIGFAALSAAFAVYEYKRGLRYDEAWFLWFKLVGIALLGIILPTAALIVRAVKNRKAGYMQ